jgi:hypothetical protein
MEVNMPNSQCSFYFASIKKMEKKKKLRQEAKKVLQKFQVGELEIYCVKAKRKKFKRWFIFLRHIRYHMRRVQKIQRRNRAVIELSVRAA